MVTLMVLSQVGTKFRGSQFSEAGRSSREFSKVFHISSIFEHRTCFKISGNFNALEEISLRYFLCD